MYKTIFWTLWERVRVEWYGRMALKHVNYHVKWIASPGSMHDTGCSGLVHWDDPKGWDREGGRRGDQDGEHMYSHVDSCQCMAKPIQYCKLKKINKTGKQWKISINLFFKRAFMYMRMILTLIFLHYLNESEFYSWLLISAFQKLLSTLYL